MTRRTPVVAAIAALIAGTAAAHAGDSSTIRIEPRPYYGAVVTMEQGVRVWRPLPPTRHMIINPTNAPVNLSVADIRETVTHNSYVHGGPAGYADPGYAAGVPYGAAGFVGRPHGFRRGHAAAPVAGLGPRPLVKRHYKKH